jgi:signal transduction histidine kinase
LNIRTSNCFILENTITHSILNQKVNQLLGVLNKSNLKKNSSTEEELAGVIDLIIQQEINKQRNIQQIVQQIHQLNHGDFQKVHPNIQKDSDFEIIFDSLDLLKIQLQAKIIKFENIDHLFSEINFPYFLVDIIKRKAYQFNKKAIEFFGLQKVTESLPMNTVLDDQFIQKIELFYQSELDSSSLEHIFLNSGNQQHSLIQFSKFNSYFTSDSHIAVIITDYSEKKKQEVTQKEQALYEKTLEINTQISTIIKNELDKPFEIINTTLKDFKIESLEQFDQLSVIKDELEKLNKSLNLLKANSSIQASSVNRELKEVSIEKLIQSNLHSYLYQSIATNCFLNYKIDKTLDKVKVDEGKLNIIINNIISNLLKFSKDNTIEINITKTKENTSTVNLGFTIKATHIYISPDSSDIFDQYQNPNISGVETNGLGISICSNLIEYLGGKLTMKVYENLGSIFEFEIETPKI